MIRILTWKTSLLSSVSVGVPAKQVKSAKSHLIKELTELAVIGLSTQQIPSFTIS